MAPPLPLRGLAALAALAVVLSAAPLAAGVARADANAPRWTGGDYWVYVRTSDNRTTRYDVIGREAVTLTQTFEAVHLRKSVTTSSGGVSTTITSDEWTRDADLGLVKSVVVIGASQVVTFDPPLAQAVFPLRAGKSWTVQSSFHLEWGPLNTTVPVTGDGSVRSEAQLTVPAGVFTAFAVRENGALNQLTGAYAIQYYSEAAGNWVKRETYNANNQRTSEEVLTAFQCQSCSSLLLVVIVVAVLVAVAAGGLLYLRNRGRQAWPPQPPVSPQP